VQFSSLLRRNNAADPAALAAVPLVRQHVERIARAADAKASGMVGVLTFAYDVGHAADVDRTRLVPAVAAITALLLGLAIRSVVVPLYLVVTALLSAVSAVGATALVLVHLMGQRGTHFVVPLLIFLFVLTLGAGHGLVVVRMVREKAVEMPLRDAVTSALDETWTTVALGGAVLAASFIALAVGASDTSASAQIQQLGWGVAAALMLDVVVMRLAVVPAIIVVLGRWNWWPAAPVSASFAGAPAQPAWQQAASGPYPTARPGYPPGPAYPPSPPTGPGPLSPPAPGAPPDDRPGGYPRPPRQPG